MIIARILPGAGMGNQMFMYAAGLAAASRLNTELRLGVWDFSYATREDRPYELQCFPAITEPDASFYEVWKVCPYLALMNLIQKKPIKRRDIFRRAMRKTVSKLFSQNGIYHAISHYTSYSPEFENIRDNTCIIGYWESEKIFAGIKDLVRKKFTFAPECFNSSFADKVRRCNSVALHIRRGDKVVSSSHHCASKAEYIRTALEKIFSMTENPSIFVFSDDINWCKENLPKIYDTDYNFIERQTTSQDMALMTLCKHVIMGPSTFSWWGAWLNENPNKIIIAPDYNLWVSNPKPDRKYLLPDEWIKIS